MLPSTQVQCPYCGEPLDLLVDDSAGDQRYIEDCRVCCRPVVITASTERDGAMHVVATREDEA